MKTIFEKVSIELTNAEIANLKKTSKALRSFNVMMRNYCSDDTMPTDIKNEFNKFDRLYLDGVLYSILEFVDGTITSED